MGVSKYDWVNIQKDYVEGYRANGEQRYPTQRELADKYGPAPSLIGRKAKKEQWLTKREIFVSKITEMRQQKSVEAISTEGSDFDLACFNISAEAADKIQQMIQMSEKASDISMLTTALKNVQAVAKNALGDKDTANSEMTIRVTVGEDNAET